MYHLDLTVLFIRILQVLSYEFLKFRILEILNFHICKLHTGGIKVSKVARSEIDTIKYHT